MRGGDGGVRGIVVKRRGWWCEGKWVERSGVGWVSEENRLNEGVEGDCVFCTLRSSLQGV